MIHRIKTVTWEVRSHNFKTVIDNDGICTGLFCLDILHCLEEIDKGSVKKVIWHLQDVLKCMRQIEKEKQKKKAYEKSIKDLGELLDERKEKGA